MATAVWGSTIQGIDEGDGWVKVERKDRSGNQLFLPESVRGNRVLVLQGKREGFFNRMHKTTTTPAPATNSAPLDTQLPSPRGKTSFFSFGGSRSMKSPREGASPQSPPTPSPPGQGANSPTSPRITATFGTDSAGPIYPLQSVDGVAGDAGTQSLPTAPVSPKAADETSWTTAHRYVGKHVFLPGESGPLRHTVTAYRSGIPPRFRILREPPLASGFSATTEVKQTELEDLMQAAKVLLWTPERDEASDGWQPTGHTYIGRRIMRVFQGKDICGTIIGFNDSPDFGADDGPDFRVIHDDEDEEDLTQTEVEIGFALLKGGVSKIQRRAPEGLPTKLLVTFVKAINFESIPHIRGDAGFWCQCMVESDFDASEQPANSCSCNAQEMRSSPPQSVIDPEWNEQRVIEQWRPGQALFFSIFMAGAPASKIVGITRLDDAHLLSTGLFAGFDGELPIKAATGHPMAGEATLHVRVEVLEPGRARRGT